MPKVFEKFILFSALIGLCRWICGEERYLLAVLIALLATFEKVALAGYFGFAILAQLLSKIVIHIILRQKKM